MAIYARYSSKIQNPLSVADQVALCRKLIGREFGCNPGEAAVFSDHELTGATDRRGGLEALLEAAERKEFDVVVAEGLDRVTRSLKDVAAIYEWMKYHEVAMHTAHEGRVTWLHVGFKGTMNAIHLDDMKDKIRRGQRARAEEGRHPSCCAYGYRLVRGVVDSKGRNINGLREINPAPAAVVRRIFEEFATGKSSKAIARDPNSDGIPPPRGAIWRMSGINGKESRGEGILRNELYRGVLVYNRTRHVINPVTKRRQVKINPESDWIRSSVPHLRIVDDALWEKVQSMLRQPRKSHTTTPAKQRAASRRPSRRKSHFHNIQPLTGLVCCGVCGGLAHVASHGRYVCAAARYTKACRNTRGKRTPEIGTAVFEALSNSLKKQTDLFSRVNALVDKERERQTKLNDEIAELDARIDQMLKLIEKRLVTERAFDRMAELEKALATAKDEMRDVPSLPTSENCVRRTLARGLKRMEMDLRNDPRPAYLRDALRQVVEKIALVPIDCRPSGSTLSIRLRPRGWPALWKLLTKLFPEITTIPPRKSKRR